MRESEVAQSCLTLRDHMDCSIPDSSIHGIFQARVLEWGATAFSRGYHRGSKSLTPLLPFLWAKGKEVLWLVPCRLDPMPNTPQKTVVPFSNNPVESLSNWPEEAMQSKLASSHSAQLWGQNAMWWLNWTAIYEGEEKGDQAKHPLSLGSQTPWSLLTSNNLPILLLAQELCSVTSHPIPSVITFQLSPDNQGIQDWNPFTIPVFSSHFFIWSHSTSQPRQCNKEQTYHYLSYMDRETKTQRRKQQSQKHLGD